jgi:hypothetical protein
MHRLEPLLFATLLWLAPMAAAAEPTALDRSTARTLADKGADLFDAGKYAEAIEDFREAEKLVHAPTHLLYLARAYAKLGKLVEAHQAYDGILTDPFITPTSPSPFRGARERAQAEDAPLVERIPTVKLLVTSPDTALVQVTIDGKRIEPVAWSEPIPVNPGSHRIEATGRGLVSDIKPVMVNERDRVNVALSLRWQGPLYPAIIALGAGGLALTIGTVTGALSLSKVSELSERCPQQHCLPADQSIGDSARALGSASTAGFILGGVLIGAGVTLAILRPGGGPPADSKEQGALMGPWIRARVGLGTTVVEGSF